MIATSQSNDNEWYDIPVYYLHAVIFEFQIDSPLIPI
jgi:hypothetical protein